MATVVVSLIHANSASDAVTWSTDNRIAVTSSDVIYVFTLKGPSFLSTTLPKHSTVPFSITTADKITSSMTNGITSSSRTQIPTAEMDDLSVFLDPSMNGLTFYDGFLVTKWSPKGCGPNGRCLLSCLTKCGRLLIYSPPSTMETKWQMVFDVSSHFIDLLTQVEYCIDKLNVHSTSDEEMDEVETPVKSKLSKTLQEVNEYFDKKALESVTAFSWFPFCLSKSTGGKCMILAMTVRRGYLILWCFDSVDNLSPNIINIIKISDSSRNWPNTIEWNTSILGYTLTIGFTSGRVDCLHWEFIEPLCSSLFSMPRPLLTLWPHEDGITTSHMTWSTVQVAKEGDSSLKWRWFIFNKTHYIIILPVILTSSSSISTLPYTLVNGIHTMPVTGLSLLHNNDIISCSVDGTVQSFSLPVSLNVDNHTTTSSHECHMTDVSISVTSVALTPAKFPLTCHGISSSKNSIFAAVGVTLVSCNKIKHQSQLQLIPLRSHDHIFNESLQNGCIISSWDVYEYLRQNPELWDEILRPEFPLSRTRRQIQYMINQAMLVAKVTSNEVSTVSGELHLMVDHARTVLEKYIDFYSTQKESLNSVSEISLTNLLCVILNSSLVTENDQQLISKVQESVPDSNLEFCPICNKEVVFTNYKRDECIEGHSWERCVITLCLITKPHLQSICSLCGAPCLQIPKDSRDNWLSWLLTEFIQCPLCNGYFESFG